MGLAVHWTVDGLLNLLVHPAMGLLLVSALALLLVHRRYLLSTDADAGALRFLVIAAMLYFGALVYALAIDPKPRMFLPVAAVSSACVGVLVVRGWQGGNRLLVCVCAALLVLKGVTAPYARTDVTRVAEAVPGWVAAEGEGIAVDRWTAQVLALSPAAAGLPIHRQGSAASVLRAGINDCALAARSRYEGWRLLRSRRFEIAEPAAVRLLRRQGLVLGPETVPVLCLMAPPAA